MEFTCATKDFALAVDTVSHAVPAHPVAQDYANILLTATEEKVTLSASDGTIYLQYTLRATVEQPGIAALDGKLLSETMRKQPGSETTLTATGARAMIRSERSKMQIATKDAFTFRDPPRMKEDALDAILPADSLQKCFDFTQYAVGTDQTRKVLTGILLEAKPGSLRTVALDGYRMAMMDAACQYEGQEIKAIIPRASAVELSRQLRDAGAGEVAIRTDGVYLRACIGSCDLYTLLIAGEFIQYEQIIPQKADTVALVSGKALRGCIERAQIMAREGKNNLIRMSFLQDTLCIASNAPDGEFSEDVDIALQGPPLDIAFNCAYMMDALRNEDTDRLEISMTNAVRPAVLRNPDAPGHLQLALPVRMMGGGGAQ